MTRPLSNIALAALSILGLYITRLAAPGYRTSQVIELGAGYVSLVLIAITLAIGPITLYLKNRRRNPVNIYLRRDAGIWAGIWGIIHVLYALRWFRDSNILNFFIEQTPAGITLRINLFGVSNDLGLIATIVLVVLLILSNQASLKWLKGKRWKNIQRLNYPLVVLVAAHALGYQLYSGKPAYFTYFLIALSTIVVVVQLLGVTLHHRQLAH